tara:strand:+ start:832616 stop:832864 length:249 start_codon:yes stop_codon:yes gene_type:complete
MTCRRGIDDPVATTGASMPQEEASFCEQPTWQVVCQWVRRAAFDSNSQGNCEESRDCDVKELAGVAKKLPVGSLKTAEQKSG